MKRAIFFLIAALIMALIVQPNLHTLDTSQTRVPENTKTEPKTNDNIDIGFSESKAVICLDTSFVDESTNYTDEEKMSETEISTQIVDTLGKYLEEADYNVIYSDQDELLNDQESISFAKKEKADYLISIQMAYDIDASMQGYSFFTHPNEELIDLCNAINEKLMSINYSQFCGLDSDHYENFLILQDPSVPTILIELGYLSNDNDYQNLTSASYQDRISKAIAEAILQQIQ